MPLDTDAAGEVKSWRAAKALGHEDSVEAVCMDPSGEMVWALPRSEPPASPMQTYHTCTHSSVVEAGMGCSGYGVGTPPIRCVCASKKHTRPFVLAD